MLFICIYWIYFFDITTLNCDKALTNFSLISVLDQDAHCSKNDPLDWMFLMMGIRRCIASLVFFNFFFFLSVNMLAVVLSISWMLSGVQQSRDCYSHFWIEYPTISSMCPCNLTSHANSDQYAWAIPVLTYVLSRLTPWCGITLSATGSRDLTTAWWMKLPSKVGTSKVTHSETDWRESVRE